MKKKLRYLILLFIIFSLFASIRFIYTSQTNKDGRLQIISSPTANVFIGNKPVGRTPFEATLAEGDVLIKLVPDAREGSSSATWNGKVHISHNARTFVSREIGSSDVTSSGVVLTVEKMLTKPDKKHTGQIDIRTKPDGAIVYLDDEEQGIAPLILSNVLEGDHELSVFSPGFFRRSQKIKVQEGYKVIADYQLALDPTHKKVELDKKRLEASDSADIQASASGTLTPTPTGVLKTTPEPGLKKIEILKTDTGWLRVRSAPSTSASESAKVTPGDIFSVQDEKSGWYLIEYIKGKTGWISADYTRVTP